ncbi:ABC transporter ATP-binding protein [Murimonas intestini]|uniref:Peptide/nickel transport system ATP-binding protein/oligopeptide transport system ATP-binding protein n=1 Tax=Murimonas intestini TaxID=1337051 RepID=A0AB73SZS8_9FIRM|nr:ABC transporter ATP-binding protein [Murimonas intestini]MCR1842812.1 ABC transporter ATP-binding protein [Murimonas intestini]MCR1867849.1 ABC transporter ATP-binding protein [Murimonas intestini]MCR1885200.1 ABC transporter ATP-binding protein [Murimonas intestini]
MAEPILEVRNLKTGFYSKKGIFYAVEDVNFTLMPGRTLGIVGESGCGKSVTCLSMLKLLPERNSLIEENSSVRMHGEELTKKSRREMCKIRGNEIAMIFQDSMTSLNPVMTIERQMVEPFMVHQKLSRAEARRKSLDMLKKVGIPSPETKIKQFPHQLSGGQRQRVMIAMALSCNPQVLIADEPTTALDVTIQAQIVRLMKELQEKLDTAIILITHDLGVVAEMADEIMVMYAGNVVEKAGKRELFEEPLHPYTKGLLASIPSLAKDTDRLYTIEGVVPSLQDMPRGCRFCDRCEYSMPRCREENPALGRIQGREVRCFLYNEKQPKEGDI